MALIYYKYLNLAKHTVTLFAFFASAYFLTLQQMSVHNTDKYGAMNKHTSKKVLSAASNMVGNLQNLLQLLQKLAECCNERAPLPSHLVCSAHVDPES